MNPSMDSGEICSGNATPNQIYFHYIKRLIVFVADKSDFHMLKDIPYFIFRIRDFHSSDETTVPR
jgi:hypothetical protein